MGGSDTVNMVPRGRDRASFPPVAVVGALGAFLAFLTAYAASPLVILGAMTLPVVVTLLVRPRAVVVLLMIVWAGPFDLLITQRHLAGLRVSAGLILLAIGLFWVLASRLGGQHPRRDGPSLFLGPFVVFLIALAWSMFTAYGAGEPRGAVVNAGLACVGGLVYFIARDAYAGQPEVLARHLVIVTGLSSAVVVLGVATGLDGLYGRQIGYVVTGGLVAEAVRIDPPLLRLLSITILMLGPGRILARGPGRFWRWPLLVAMVTAEVLSLTRSTWAPLILAAVLTGVVAARRGRGLLMGRYLSVLVVTLALGLGAATTGLLGEQGRVAAERLYSATDESALNDSSFQDRVAENVAALDRIREHPVTGIGLTREFGIYGSIPDPINDAWRLVAAQRFIHQSYLGLWMWFGLPGVVALLWLMRNVIVAGVRVMREPRLPRDAPVAALAGLTVLAISSTFQTNIMYPPAHLALGLGLAYVELWLRAADATRAPRLPRNDSRPVTVARLAGGSPREIHLKAVLPGTLIHERDAHAPR